MESVIILQRILQTALFPSAILADFYRFAVLLTGSIKTAEKIMAEILTEADGHISQIRNETGRMAWLATRIRERCLNNQLGASSGPRLLREEAAPGEKLEILEIEAYLVAQRFHQLPEPERSALGLFYLDFFSDEEICRLLKLHEADLPETLKRARELLHDQLRAMRSAHS